MAIPTKSQADQLRGIEERLEALERKRPFIPPGELREFDEFVADLRDTIEILRRDLVRRRLTMSHMEAPGTAAPPVRYALDLAERVPENAIWPVAVRFGLVTSLAMFFVSSPPILLDQWISGQVSAFFMLGTMLVLLGFSVGWFGTILGIGLVISIFSGAADAVAITTRAHRAGESQKPNSSRMRCSGKNASTCAAEETGRQTVYGEHVQPGRKVPWRRGAFRQGVT